MTSNVVIVRRLRRYEWYVNWAIQRYRLVLNDTSETKGEFACSALYLYKTRRPPPKQKKIRTTGASKYIFGANLSPQSSHQVSALDWGSAPWDDAVAAAKNITTVHPLSITTSNVVVLWQSVHCTHNYNGTPKPGSAAALPPLQWGRGCCLKQAPSPFITTSSFVVLQQWVSYAQKEKGTRKLESTGAQPPCDDPIIIKEPQN